MEKSSASSLPLRLAGETQEARKRWATHAKDAANVGSNPWRPGLKPSRSWEFYSPALRPVLPPETAQAKSKRDVPDHAALRWAETIDP